MTETRETAVASTPVAGTPPDSMGFLENIQASFAQRIRNPFVFPLLLALAIYYWRVPVALLPRDVSARLVVAVEGYFPSGMPWSTVAGELGLVFVAAFVSGLLFPVFGLGLKLASTVIQEKNVEIDVGVATDRARIQRAAEFDTAHKELVDRDDDSHRERAAQLEAGGTTDYAFQKSDGSLTAVSRGTTPKTPVTPPEKPSKHE